MFWFIQCVPHFVIAALFFHWTNQGEFRWFHCLQLVKDRQIMLSYGKFNWKIYVDKGVTCLHCVTQTGLIKAFRLYRHRLITLRIIDILEGELIIPVNAVLLLTYRGLVAIYDDINLGQHWLKLWLLPQGIKPLPESMLTSDYCSYVAFTWEQFNSDCPRYYSVSWVWKIIFIILLPHLPGANALTLISDHWHYSDVRSGRASDGRFTNKYWISTDYKQNHYMGHELDRNLLTNKTHYRVGISIQNSYRPMTTKQKGLCGYMYFGTYIE